MDLAASKTKVLSHDGKASRWQEFLTNLLELIIPILYKQLLRSAKVILNLLLLLFPL